MRARLILALVALALVGGLGVGIGTEPASAAVTVDQICNRAYPEQFSKTYDVRLGTRKVFSQDLSRALVCSGDFGAPDQFSPTVATACDLIMAAYGVRNPKTGVLPDLGCAAPNIRERGWVRGSLSTATSVACGYLVNVLGTGLGVLAAGATLNPASGVVVWAGTSFIGDTIICIGINKLTAAAKSWGSRLESDHQVNVARDVELKGKCLQLTTRRFAGRQWSAVTCPAELGGSTLPPATPAAGSIVRNPVNGASWLITASGYRNWIPTGGIWLCLRDRGSRVVSMDQASINRIPDQVGVHAACSPGVPGTGGRTSDPGPTGGSGNTPPVVTSPKPYAGNLIAVNYGGGHVGVAFDVGWQPGRDPVTCHFFRNGIEVFSAQCGTRSSKQFYDVPPGRHTFSATVSDAFGVYSDSTNSVSVEVLAPTPSTPVSDRLSNDERLDAASSQFLQSGDGRYRLVMQADSNLVLYGPRGVPIWASNTVGRGANHLRMQGDGNLVIYNGANTPVWATNTPRNYSSFLFVQNDGNVVIYNAGAPIWATNTGGRT